MFQNLNQRNRLLFLAAGIVIAVLAWNSNSKRIEEETPRRGASLWERLSDIGSEDPEQGVAPSGQSSSPAGRVEGGAKNEASTGDAAESSSAAPLPPPVSGEKQVVEQPIVSNGESAIKSPSNNEAEVATPTVPNDTSKNSANSANRSEQPYPQPAPISNTNPTENAITKPASPAPTSEGAREAEKRADVVDGGASERSTPSSNRGSSSTRGGRLYPGAPMPSGAAVRHSELPRIDVTTVTQTLRKAIENGNIGGVIMTSPEMRGNTILFSLSLSREFNAFNTAKTQLGTIFPGVNLNCHNTGGAITCSLVSR